MHLSNINWRQFFPYYNFHYILYSLLYTFQFEYRMVLACFSTPKLLWAQVLVLDKADFPLGGLNTLLYMKLLGLISSNPDELKIALFVWSYVVRLRPTHVWSMVFVFRLFLCPARKNFWLVNPEKIMDSLFLRSYTRLSCTVTK